MHASGWKASADVCREWLARSRCGTKTITQETASSSAKARIGTLYLMRMKRPFTTRRIGRGREPLQTEALSYSNMFSHQSHPEAHPTRVVNIIGDSPSSPTGTGVARISSELVKRVGRRQEDIQEARVSPWSGLVIATRAASNSLVDLYSAAVSSSGFRADF